MPATTRHHDKRERDALGARGLEDVRNERSAEEAGATASAIAFATSDPLTLSMEHFGRALLVVFREAVHAHPKLQPVSVAEDPKVRAALRAAWTDAFGSAGDVLQSTPALAAQLPFVARQVCNAAAGAVNAELDACVLKVCNDVLATLTFQDAPLLARFGWTGRSSPPPAELMNQCARNWQLPATTVTTAYAEAQTQYAATDLGIVFLLAKGVTPTNRELRAVRFKQLLNPSSDEWQACRQRLDSLVQLEGDRTWDADPEGWQTLNDFRDAVPAWQDRDIFHLRKGVTLPRRHQLSGLCYIHAPEVLQHYLVSLSDPNVGMIDMVKLVRESFDAKLLEQHVFDDAGGSSRAVLKMILEKDSEIIASYADVYEQHLLQHGPGLVAGFAVYADFHAAQSMSYDGKPTGNLVGHHAMVLIGARRDPSGKRFFLVQNWWKQSQFVELSEQYLKACDATVYFVQTRQLKIPETFPTQPHLIAENENIDKPEQMMFENPVAPPKEFV